ncbi:MAG: AbrB/MazE/SpoVT family DNA-binding domain-containing protein [Candidatus Omnitrophica bacterium]|nr:AbrB/MazE/SpoVT family DNA-binding domain-containing protein [Candidatus Omnitrophota bacterium]
MKTLNKGRYYMSHITSKGQTTIPRAVRALLGLKEGSEIAFKAASGGFMLLRVTTTIKEDNPYTPQEWKKIEKLASAKGKAFDSADAAIRHLHKAS